MNNNDILNELNSSADSFAPSDRLAPDSIEKSLSGVKRRSYKGVATACTSLAVVCLTVVGVRTALLQNSGPQAPVVEEKSQTNSYHDIYKAVKKVKKKKEGSIFDRFIEAYMYQYSVDSISVSADALGAIQDNSLAKAESFETNSATTGVAGQAAEHSETNNQVSGVDEADVVKTDGKYIYSVNDDQIFITAPNNGMPARVSTINCDFDVKDIFIHKNTLVAVAEYSTYRNSNDVVAGSTDKENFADYVDDSSFTRIFVYDLTNVNSPVLKNELTQVGEYLTSRKVNDVVYFTTRYSISDYDKIDEKEPKTYCPIYCTGEQIECIPSEDIVISDNAERIEYVTVASLDLKNTQDFADVCSVLGDGYNVYASLNNIYVSAVIPEDNYDVTQILRFSINGADIEQNGSLTVDGSLLNQFSMDEYNGYFRVVTQKNNIIFDRTSDIGLTSGRSRYTALYVFDSNLKQVGKTENVAEGENVKSVRFDGDVAYFVTFRQTDPLFTVDLSDPTYPKILSELKIPGFSEYLHPFGDGLLLGFGREADPETGRTQGLKLTMFNTADKTNVTELATKVFTDINVESSAEYNHKAVFVDVKNSIIGIPYFDYNDKIFHYVIFKYDVQTNSFVECRDIGYKDEVDRYYGYLNEDDYMRGLYIGDYFYVVTLDDVFGYKYLTFEDVTASSESGTSSTEIPTEIPTEALPTEEIPTEESSAKISSYAESLLEQGLPLPMN